MVAFSVLVVAISAVTLVFTLDEPYPRFFGFIALIASIVIVVMSAAQIESDEVVTAHLLYNSAVEISNMRRALMNFSEDEFAKNLPKYVSEYGSILTSYGVNHEDRDFELYKIRNKWEFEEFRGSSTSSFSFLSELRFYLKSLPAVLIFALVGGALGSLIVVAIEAALRGVVR